ncbi:MAG: ATP synthase A1 subunit C [Archaeoglobus sp.]|nr:MAG: ATP synthase A1 subunit C [Archaeoglobus sp.]
MTLGKKSQWAYIVARVKVMKRSLIPKEEFRKLLNMDFNEIVRYLEESEYKKEIDELSYKYSGPRLIDYALSLHLFRKYKRILDVSFGAAKELVFEYLKRWDIWNIINILRGKLANVSPEEIEETLVPVGEFSYDFYKALTAKEVDEIVKAFDRTPYYEVLSKVGQEPIGQIEDELYKIYYSRIISMRPSDQPLKLFVDFIKKEIDIKNIKTILRLKIDDVPPDTIAEKIIPGGYQLNLDEARKLASMPLDELLKAMEGYWFWKEIEIEDSFSKVEIKLDSVWMEEVARKADYYPLSILPVLHYMCLKKIEVDNLRVIGWGKWENLPNEAIEEQLVMV